jgi:hypothetical protein
MHIKTISSAAILVATLGFSGFVYAQDAAMALPTMIGNQQLTEADAQRVKVHCDDLQTAENQAVGTSSDDTESAEAEEGSDTDAEDSSDPADIGSVDFDAITLETCIEAGFIDATP